MKTENVQISETIDTTTRRVPHLVYSAEKETQQRQRRQVDDDVGYGERSPE